MTSHDFCYLLMDTKLNGTHAPIIEENVTLVLLAEFDNENGVVVRHKYPVDKYESILESSK